MIELFTKKGSKKLTKEELMEIKQNVKSGNVNIDLKRHLANMIVTIEYFNHIGEECEELHCFLRTQNKKIKG